MVKLKRNRYGQKQAGRQFYLHLVKGLMELVFTQSKVDKCVFYRDGVIFAVYVDDGLIFAKNPDDVQISIEQLKTKFNVEDKQEVKDYLGVHFEKSSQDNTITLTQKHLIQQLIKVEPSER